MTVAMIILVQTGAEMCWLEHGYIENDFNSTEKNFQQMDVTIFFNSYILSSQCTRRFQAGYKHFGLFCINHMVVL